MKVVDISLSVLVFVLVLYPVAQICTLVLKLVAPGDLSWTCTLMPTLVLLSIVAVDGIIAGVYGILRKIGV